MCNKCNGNSHPDPYSEDWKKWDGRTEIKQIWTDKSGQVHHVSEADPAPSGAHVEWGLYGHNGVDGGVFWIADFPIGAHSACESLAARLEQSYQDAKEIERLTECLENPVGYVNQGRLAELREGEGTGNASISARPDSYHNAAIYAQD